MLEFPRVVLPFPYFREEKARRVSFKKRRRFFPPSRLEVASRSGLNLVVIVSITPFPPDPSDCSFFRLESRKSWVGMIRSSNLAVRAPPLRRARFSPSLSERSSHIRRCRCPPAATGYRLFYGVLFFGEHSLSSFSRVVALPHSSMRRFRYI